MPKSVGFFIVDRDRHTTANTHSERSDESRHLYRPVNVRLCTHKRLFIAQPPYTLAFTAAPSNGAIFQEMVIPSEARNLLFPFIIPRVFPRPDWGANRESCSVLAAMVHKMKKLESVLSTFGCHAPKLFYLHYPIKPFEAIAQIVNVPGCSSCCQECQRWGPIHRLDAHDRTRHLDQEHHANYR